MEVFASGVQLQFCQMENEWIHPGKILNVDLYQIFSSITIVLLFTQSPKKVSKVIVSLASIVLCNHESISASALLQLLYHKVDGDLPHRNPVRIN